MRGLALARDIGTYQSPNSCARAAWSIGICPLASTATPSLEQDSNSLIKRSIRSDGLDGLGTPMDLLQHAVVSNTCMVDINQTLERAHFRRWAHEPVVRCEHHCIAACGDKGVATWITSAVAPRAPDRAYHNRPADRALAVICKMR